MVVLAGITRCDHSIIACLPHIYIWVLFFAHILFVVNCTFNATPTKRLQQEQFLLYAIIVQSAFFTLLDGEKHVKTIKLLGTRQFFTRNCWKQETVCSIKISILNSNLVFQYAFSLILLGGNKTCKNGPKKFGPKVVVLYKVLGTKGVELLTNWHANYH